MFKNVRLPEPVRRLYRRVEAYFRALIDPSLSVRARVFSGAKGLVAIGALGLALLCAYAVILIPFTPSISNLRKAKIDQPSVLMSVDGKRLATFKPMNREWVRLNQISPHVINALIATEDHRFYQHYGIDLRHRDGPAARLRRRSGRRFHSHPAARPQPLPGGHWPQTDHHTKIKGNDHRD